MSLHDWASKYLEMGLSVFPVDGISKKPLIEWATFQTEKPKAEDIDRWWKKWPQAGIGCATGKVSGFVVVDAEAQADMKLFDLDTLETPMTLTGGGGHHFFFAYQPLKNAVRFAPFFDFRGDGGYVILPPTVHKTGKKYDWVVPFGSIAIQSLPSVIVEKLTERNKANVSHLLSTITQEGQRNNGAASVAGMLLLRFKPLEWPSKAYPLFESWNAKKNDPPLPVAELRATFDSIARKELARRQSLQNGTPTFSEDSIEPELVADGEQIIVRLKTDDGLASFVFDEIEQSRSREIDATLVVELLVPGSHPKPFSGRLNVLSMSAKEGFARGLSKSFGKDIPWDLLLARATEAVRGHLASLDKSSWIEELPDEENKMAMSPFLSKGGSNVFFGKGGSGKTYLALRIALSYAVGIPFLGNQPEECKSVLFVDYEATGGEIKDRIRRILASKDVGFSLEMIEKRFRYLKLDGAVPDCLLILKKAIESSRVGLVIIDSAVQACGGEPERAEIASRYFNALRSLKTTTLTIAHETKLENHSYPFGSVFFWNAPRNIWNVQCESEDDDRIKQVGLFHRKNNNGALHKPIGVKLFHGDDFTDISFGDLSLWEKEMSTSARILKNLSEPKTFDDLQSDLSDVASNTLKQSLKRLHKKGKIILNGGHGGRWSLGGG